MNSKGAKIHKINDLLECPVCFETIISAPIFQCHNGHIVCKDCHPKLETCPICRDAEYRDTCIRNLRLEEIVKRCLSVKMDSKGVKINDLIECPVCFTTIFSTPIFQCYNGHIVCKDCQPKLETCLICRDGIIFYHLYDTPMAIRNLKLEEIVKRIRLSNSETARMTWESIQIDAIVPKTPNVRVNINQGTSQVPVQLNNCCLCCCGYLFLIIGFALLALLGFLLWNWRTTSYTNLSRLAAIEEVRAIATFYFFIAILKWPFQRNMFQKSAKN